MVYLQTTYEVRFWGSVFWIFWIMEFLLRKYKYRCTHVYVWYKDDKHVIWMWIWLILKNISLLDRIWSVWLVRFSHSPTNFIFWLGRLIFSASINSHPDNTYICSTSCFYFISYWWDIIFLIIRISTCQFLGLFTEINKSNLFKLVFCDFLRV